MAGTVGWQSRTERRTGRLCPDLFGFVLDHDGIPRTARHDWDWRGANDGDPDFPRPFFQRLLHADRCDRSVLALRRPRLDLSIAHALSRRNAHTLRNSGMASPIAPVK